MIRRPRAHPRDMFASDDSHRSRDGRARKNSFSLGLKALAAVLRPLLLPPPPTRLTAQTPNTTTTETSLTMEPATVSSAAAFGAPWAASTADAPVEKRKRSIFDIQREEMERIKRNREAGSGGGSEPSGGGEPFAAPAARAAAAAPPASAPVVISLDSDGDDAPPSIASHGPPRVTQESSSSARLSRWRRANMGV